MTLGMYARHKAWPLESVRVDLTHDRIHAQDCADCESQTGQIDVIERSLTVRGPLDEAQRQRLLEIADRCPVHKTLMNEKRIRTRFA
jgi:putative redox protein